MSDDLVGLHGDCSFITTQITWTDMIPDSAGCSVSRQYRVTRSSDSGETYDVPEVVPRAKDLNLSVFRGLLCYLACTQVERVEERFTLLLCDSLWEIHRRTLTSERAGNGRLRAKSIIVVIMMASNTRDFVFTSNTRGMIKWGRR